MPYITIHQLRAKLRPLVNARFSGRARPYVDLRAAWHPDSEEARKGYPDCDIRGLTGAGVLRQWDGGEECIPWHLIRSATFGTVDGNLDRQVGETFHVVHSRQPMQVAA